MPTEPQSTAPGQPTPAPLPPAAPAPARTDPARLGWLRLVIARQALARCTELIEEWRLLRAARGTGRAQRRGSWRRLAHAAASLLLVMGGLVRGLALPWPVEAATIPFTGHTIDGGFAGANSVTYADLDNDVDLDVLGAATTGDAITWWENNGASPPAWTTHTIDSGFGFARSVAAADLDGDGDVDVLGAALNADDITWWRNDGSPADGGWTTHTIDGDFNGAARVAAADLDGDGHLDVLGAALSANDITWWENDGTPANGGWITHTIDDAFAGAKSIAAADLDSDGDLDVLGAATTGDDITWWKSDGTPGDGGWITHTIDGDFDGANSVAAADLDGDGHLDVLGGAYVADDITWWESDGTPADGGWTTHTIEEGTFNGPSYDIAAADLDADGDLDVLGVALGASKITWWENDGTPANGGWITHTIDGGFSSARSVAAADIDGDGDLDVLGAAFLADDITWWENRTIHRNALLGGTIPYTHTIDGAFSGATSVASADLDGDGDLDVLGAASSADDITWWESDGTPANGGWTTHTISGAFDGAYSIAAADLDGDGDLDVLGAALGDGDITWWESDGTPADGGWTTHTISGAFVAAFSVAAADLDGDGDLDVLGTANGADDITWWENDGTPADGGWTTHTIITNFDGAAGISAADLDNDGDLDVLGAADVGDDITWWESDGTPADGGWTTHTIDADFDGASGVAAADLDGDGDLDVLGAAFYDDEITWWESDGTPANGGWTTHTIGALNGARSVAAADLDGDGDLDVLGASRVVSGNITWWESDGTPADGGWTTHIISSPFVFASCVAAADLDKDGDLDVLGTSNSNITWWSNHGGQFTLPTTGTAPATINAGATDDFLKIVFTHNGRTGDNDEELATFQLRFEETAPGSGALTDSEANAIIDEVQVYLDTGNGTFQGTDTLVTSVTTLALDGNGDQIVSFTDGDGNVQLPFATGTRTYFAVLKLTTTYLGDPARNGITKIRMTHITEASSTAEDAANDLPAGMAFNANQQSSTGGTTLQGPLAVTINLFKAEPSGSSPAGWLLRFGALGAAVAGVWAAWRRRRGAPGGDTRGVVR